jgi:hypothetical protein
METIVSTNQQIAVLIGASPTIPAEPRMGWLARVIAWRCATAEASARRHIRQLPAPAPEQIGALPEEVAEVQRTGQLPAASWRRALRRHC